MKRVSRKYNHEMWQILATVQEKEMWALDRRLVYELEQMKVGYLESPITEDMVEEREECVEMSLGE